MAEASRIRKPVLSATLGIVTKQQSQSAGVMIISDSAKAYQLCTSSNPLKQEDAKSMWSAAGELTSACNVSVLQGQEQRGLVHVAHVEQDAATSESDSKQPTAHDGTAVSFASDAAQQLQAAIDQAQMQAQRARADVASLQVCLL
jgi:hypothetical protein